MKHIIVPIDFSEDSINGLREATIFANKFGSKIQLVYVQKSPSELGRVGFEEEKKTAKDKLKQIEQEYAPKLAGDASITHIVKKGKIFREVVNQAQAFDESIIVCSTHGASGFEELFIGSNAFKIISATDLPVITIRHGSMPRNIENIILPIDLTSDTRQKVPITKTLALSFDAEVHVIGVASQRNDESEAKIGAYTKQVCDYLKDHKVRYKQENLFGDEVCALILKYAADVNADLISIMTDQDEGLSSFVLGTHAQHMLNQSAIPILSITPKDLFILGSFHSPGGNF